MGLAFFARGILNDWKHQVHKFSPNKVYLTLVAMYHTSSCLEHDS